MSSGLTKRANATTTEVAGFHDLAEPAAITEAAVDCSTEEVGTKAVAGRCAEEADHPTEEVNTGASTDRSAEEVGIPTGKAAIVATQNTLKEGMERRLEAPAKVMTRL